MLRSKQGRVRRARVQGREHEGPRTLGSASKEKSALSVATSLSGVSAGSALSTATMPARSVGTGGPWSAAPLGGMMELECSGSSVELCPLLHVVRGAF